VSQGWGEASPEVSEREITKGAKAHEEHEEEVGLSAAGGVSIALGEGGDPPKEDGVKFSCASWNFAIFVISD